MIYDPDGQSERRLRPEDHDAYATLTDSLTNFEEGLTIYKLRHLSKTHYGTMPYKLVRGADFSSLRKATLSLDQKMS